MLPGLRFLFAAILLSTSILVFGLGAAALLRATHEQVVSNPSWRTGPQEQAFAQAPTPVLAVMRAEPLPVDDTPAVRDQVPTIGLPESPPEPAAEASPVPAPQAAEAPADTTAVASAASDTPAAPPAPETAASIPDDKSAAPAIAASAPQPAETAASPAAPEPDATATRVAALGDPTVTAPKDASPKAKADSSTQESKPTKRRAHRAKKRRTVRRPPPTPVQQTYDPFTTQQQPAYASTTARTR